MDIPICWAPAPMRACFAAEVPAGSGHWKGSPSAPRGARVLRLVGTAIAERARVAATVATLSLKGMMRRGRGFLLKEKNVLYALNGVRLFWG